MSAVAKHVGAPSGSIYHRFTGRAALLAEVWLRTVERFQAGYLQALKPVHRDGGARQAVRGGCAAARHVVAWSRAHPDEAVLLVHGPEEFGHADWPKEHLDRTDDGNERMRAAVGRVAAALGAQRPQDTERVVLALIEMPLALVRRHVKGGSPLPPHAEDLAEECAAALLDAPTGRRL